MEYMQLCTYRNEYVEEVFQSGQLREEFLDHLTEGLKYGVIIDAGEIETENK